MKMEAGIKNLTLIFEPCCFGVLVFMEHVYLQDTLVKAVALTSKVKKGRFHIFESMITLKSKGEEIFFLLVKNFIFLPLEAFPPFP